MNWRRQPRLGRMSVVMASRPPHLAGVASRSISSLVPRGAASALAGRDGRILEGWQLLVAVMRTVATRRERTPWPLLRLLLARRCRAWIEIDHAQHLNAFAALSHLAVDRRSLRRILQSSLLEGGNVQKYVLRSVCWRNETITLLRIKPLDRTVQFRAFPARGTAGLLTFVHYAHFCSSDPHGLPWPERPIIRIPTSARPRSSRTSIREGQCSIL